ncbi:MAG: hypothetical protein K2K81_04425 [Muribaculaceae bacterium]|nr:hypothetical protein [Muribaculaceae bacterium]
MKKFLLLAGVGLLAASASMNAAKVYFDNEGTGWTSVYGYSWSPDYLQELSTETIDGHTLYVADLENAQIIFRGSSTQWSDALQTTDLPVTDGAVYGKQSLKSEGASIYPIANIIDGVYTPAGDVEITYAKIYIPASEWDYDKCYIYSWSPDLFGSWPGKEMTKVTIDNLGEGNPSSYWMVEIDENLIKDKKIGGWKVNAGIDQAESSNIENQTVFQNDYVYHISDGTSHLLGEHSETPVDPSDYTKVYFMSDRYNFATSPDFLMSTEDGQTYTLKIADAGSDIAFKFMAKLPNGDKWFSNGAQNIQNGTYTISGNSETNMTFHTGGAVTLTLKPINDFSAIEVKIEGQDPDADPYPPIYLVSKALTNWEAEEAYRLQTTDGVNYTISVENMSGDDPFKFLGGDAHNYYFSNGLQNMANGDDYELNTEGSTGNMTLDNGGNVTFNFVLGDMHKTATLSISGQEETVDEYPRMYLIGERTGWAALEKYRMTTTDGKTYTLNVPDMSTKDFRFCGKDVNTTNLGGAGKKLADGTYDLTAGKNNMTLAKGGNVTFTLSSEDNFETATLVVAGQGEIDPVDPTYDNEFYIHGNIFGDPNWSSEKMTFTDGKFVLANKKVITGSFGIKEVDPTITEPGKNPQVNWYQAVNADDADVVLDKTIALTDGDGTNLILYAGTYTFTFDPEALTLIVTGTQTEFPTEGFEGWTVTLAGTHNKYNATDPEYTAKVSEDGKAVLSIIGLTPETGFKFVVNKPSVTWYGITEPIELGKPLTLGDTGMSNPVFSEANPKYKYTFDVDLSSKPYTVTITEDKTTGINSLNADSSEAVYFNLQGVKIEKPENGLFIEVRNGQTRKVMVK